MVSVIHLSTASRLIFKHPATETKIFHVPASPGLSKKAVEEFKAANPDCLVRHSRCGFAEAGVGHVGFAISQSMQLFSHAPLAACEPRFRYPPLEKPLVISQAAFRVRRSPATPMIYGVCQHLVECEFTGDVGYCVGFRVGLCRISTF